MFGGTSGSQAPKTWRYCCAAEITLHNLPSTLQDLLRDAPVPVLARVRRDLASSGEAKSDFR